jgi:hypothetical protein
MPEAIGSALLVFELTVWWSGLRMGHVLNSIRLVMRKRVSAAS